MIYRNRWCNINTRYFWNPIFCYRERKMVKRGGIGFEEDYECYRLQNPCNFVTEVKFAVILNSCFLSSVMT